MSKITDAPPGATSLYECVVRPSLAGDGSWVIEYPDLPGCFAHAPSRREALELSESVLETWLAKAQALGIERPVIGMRTISKMRIRTARSLHEDLVAFADRSGLSLNETVTQLLYSGIARWLNNNCSATGVCSADNLVVPKRARQVRAHTKTARPNGFSGSWLQRLPTGLFEQVKSIAQIDGDLSVNMTVSVIITRELERAVSQLSRASPEAVEHAA